MKKITFILLVLLISTSVYSQKEFQDSYGKYHLETTKSFTPAEVIIRGKQDNPAIASRIIEILGVQSGKYVYPIFEKDKGYGNDGTFSKIYINGEYFDQVQFLDKTQESLRFVLDQSATTSSLDALGACPTQLSVLTKTYNQAIKKGVWVTEESKVYTYVFSNQEDQIKDDHVTIQPTEVVTKNEVTFKDFDFSGGLVEKKEPQSFSYGKINFPTSTVVSSPRSTGTYVNPYTTQVSSPSFSQENKNIQGKEVVNQCTQLQEKYPNLISLYQKTNSTKIFNTLNWSERMAIKKCVTGKNYLGRNWAWIGPLAAGLVFTSIDAFSDKVNILWGKSERGSGKIIHTETRLLTN